MRGKPDVRAERAASSGIGGVETGPRQRPDDENVDPSAPRDGLGSMAIDFCSPFRESQRL